MMMSSSCESADIVTDNCVTSARTGRGLVMPLKPANVFSRRTEQLKTNRSIASQSLSPRGRSVQTIRQPVLCFLPLSMDRGDGETLRSHESFFRPTAAETNAEAKSRPLSGMEISNVHSGAYCYEHGCGDKVTGEKEQLSTYSISSEHRHHCESTRQECACDAACPVHTFVSERRHVHPDHHDESYGERFVGVFNNQGHSRCEGATAANV